VPAVTRGRSGSRARFGARRVVGIVTAVCAAVSVGPATAGAGAAQGGAFFTLGFRGSGQTFVVLVRERQAIRGLRADLSKPRRERRIVSGIVRRGRPYNQPWSYAMGPRSIVLGQVFIEVCDASPTYVESRRADWLGRRWCPWSSYVKRAGR
jgi:hypothetical protein